MYKIIFMVLLITNSIYAAPPIVTQKNVFGGTNIWQNGKLQLRGTPNVSKSETFRNQKGVVYRGQKTITNKEYWRGNRGNGSKSR